MRFSIRELIVRTGEPASSLVDQGIAAEEAGDPAQAARLYRQALAADPRNAAAHCNLGLLRLADGAFPEAETALREAVRLKAPFPEAWVALADALEEQGRDDESLAALENAIAQRENYHGALMNAAALLQKKGRLPEAETMYRNALAAEPDSPAAHHDLGNVLLSLHRLPEAEACFRRVLAIDPNAATAHSNLANVLREAGRLAEAEACAREALRIAEFPQAHNNLGTILQAQGRACESVESLRRAVALDPGYKDAHNSLGNSLKDLGLLDEAEAAFRAALSLDRADRDARSNLLLLLNYSANHSRELVHEEHVAWAKLHEVPLAPERLAARNDRNPDRRLRVGYVSGDFRRHSVAYFIEPILARHDRANFEVHCYSNVARPDGTTAHLFALADHSHAIYDLGDEEAARKIREDGIDLLVDLSGHTGGNRLGVFARKPAPVQLTYLGYPNTTGLRSIDGRITDAHADPAGEADRFHSEKLLRLPGPFLSFAPPPDAPDVRPPPSAKGGNVTFGSFNVLPKMTKEVVRVWATLLSRLQGSRLFLKSHGLGDAGSRERVLDVFAKAGVERNRIELLPLEGSLQAHLARYHEIDIALDPFPFNGTTTTLEAMWMGVPVVTLRGDRHSGRVGASLLSSVGLQSLVADDVESYLAVAATLANDGPRLAQLRSSLRDRVAASPLMDRAAFIRALEALYRDLWMRWCAGSGDPVKPG